MAPMVTVATSGARFGGTKRQGPFGHRAISRHRLIRLYYGLPVRFAHWLPPLPSPAAWYRHLASAFLIRQRLIRRRIIQS